MLISLLKKRYPRYNFRFIYDKNTFAPILTFDDTVNSKIFRIEIMDRPGNLQLIIETIDEILNKEIEIRNDKIDSILN